jgi:undecaprenyl-diphosphatase
MRQTRAMESQTSNSPIDDARHTRPSRRFERGPLIALASVLALLAGFALLLLAVQDGQAGRFDGALLTWLRDGADLSQPRAPGWVTALFSEITHLGGTVTLTLATMVVIGLLLFERKDRAAMLVALSVAGGTFISTMTKLGVARPRPDLVPHLVEVTSPSFPSGHAMLSAVVYLTLGAMLAQFEFSRPATRVYVMMLAIALTLAIGFSRVFLGVHWPSDVLAGWCLGAAWAIVCLMVARLLERRGALRGDSPARVR